MKKTVAGELPPATRYLPVMLNSAQPYTCRLRDVDIGLFWGLPEMPRREKSRLPSNILDTSW